MSALAMIAGRSFNGKFTEKNNFRLEIHVTIANVDIKSPKSLQYSLDVYRPHVGEI